MIGRPYPRWVAPTSATIAYLGAEGGGGPGRLAPGADVELGQDGGHVVVDGPDRDDQAAGDLGVGQALGEQLKDLELAVGEAGRVGPGAVAGAAGEVADADAAQVAADQVGRGDGAEPVEGGQRLQQLGLAARGGQLEGVLVGGAERPP